MTEREWLTSDDPARMLTYLNGLNSKEVFERAKDRVPRMASDRKLRLFAVACCRQSEVWDRLTDDVPCGRCRGGGKVDLRMDNIVLSGVTCPDCSGTGRINRSRRAVEVSERYADGKATEQEIAAAYVLPSPHELGEAPIICQAVCASNPMDGVTRIRHTNWVPVTTQASLLRCIAGNPWQPVRLPPSRCPWCVWLSQLYTCPNCKRQGAHRWLTHNDGAVLKLARIAYDSLDWSLLPLIADALEEAGCEGTETCPQCDGSGYHERRNTHSTDVFDCPPCNSTGRVSNPILAHLRGSGPHARGCHVVDALLGKE